MFSHRMVYSISLDVGLMALMPPPLTNSSLSFFRCGIETLLSSARKNGVSSSHRVSPALSAPFVPLRSSFRFFECVVRVVGDPTFPTWTTYSDMSTKRSNSSGLWSSAWQQIVSPAYSQICNIRQQVALIMSYIRLFKFESFLKTSSITRL